MDKYKLFALVSLGILISVAAFYGARELASREIGSSGGYITNSELNSLNITPPGVQVSSNQSAIYINNSTTLPVLMGPMYAPSMYSFEILRLINPTIVVKEGVSVHFIVINVDTDSYHNFAISNRGPPYPYMVGMMGLGFEYKAPYLPPVHSDLYAYSEFNYTFSSIGDYWYLCTYPGHAENGMYGEIIVR
ncbi:membrane protein [Thermoplasma volcanium GSS1]|uniref:Rusticyanin n=1 Tax=Thermoplasma volcanium (strain ATCC 51530 / DSM 4299 / JCM 9571 / NBRC 15438 / GSS1) TaxID=273116 RepID=Q978E0_THEVO|nr:rusticyanin [Thermoplasma volcanium]BAB60619.1 membrane protein [Thermoplasma volcanium GSS1]